MHGDIRSCRHAGAQEQVLVVDRQDRLVGHDIIDGFGGEADGFDLCREMPVGVGIDRKTRFLPFADLADIGLVDGDLQLHVFQVARYGKEHRCIERGGDGRARIDVAGENDAVDRRDDLQLGEIDFGQAQAGFSGKDGCLIDIRRCDRRIIGIFGGVKILLAGDSVADQRGQPIEADLCGGGFGLGLQNVGPCGGKLGSRALDIGFLPVGIEFQQHLARLDGAVIADIDLAHRARQFARYVDLVGRLDRACGGDDHLQVTGLCSLCRVVELLAVAGAVKIEAEATAYQHKTEHKQPLAAPALLFLARGCEDRGEIRSVRLAGTEGIGRGVHS
ncbi:hypothetical protein D3C80_1119560 [compost metagenome]